MKSKSNILEDLEILGVCFSERLSFPPLSVLHFPSVTALLVNFAAGSGIRNVT